MELDFIRKPSPKALFGQQIYFVEKFGIGSLLFFKTTISGLLLKNCTNAKLQYCSTSSRFKSN